MKLLIIIFALCFHYVCSTKKSGNILRSEILDENFKDFGKFAQSLFRDDSEATSKKTNNADNTSLLEKNSKEVKNLRKNEKKLTLPFFGNSINYSKAMMI